MNANTSQSEEIYYYINQNEDKFKLEIKLTNEVAIFSVKNENNISTKYSIKLELKDIIKKNKLFKIYDSISEFIDSIKILVDKKLITIKEIEEQNKCILEMIYSDTLFKENKVDFELIHEEKNKDELIKDFVSIVKNLETKLKNLEKENEYLKREIIQIKNSILLIQKNNEEEPFKKILDFPSNILIDKKELDLLIYYISSMENKNIKLFKKLYCASLDGDDAFYFHQKCDGKFDTLVLIKTPDKRRFGGFTHANWNGGNNYEPKTFLFSLDLLKIYPRKEKGYSILFYTNKGPVFGGGNEIEIGDKCISTKSFSIKNESKNFDFLGIKSPLSNLKDNEKIELIDYEVYQVIFYTN